MKKNKFKSSAIQARKMSDAQMKLSAASKPVVDEEDTLEDRLEDIFETGKDRFEKAMASWNKIRQNALEDLKFYKGDQWGIENQRTGAQRKEPNLTVNRFPQFVKQVENELRKQQITISVYPTDETGSEETAQVFAGLIRDIERKSYAQSAYIHAAGEAGAMVPGFGFLKIETKYADQHGFNQEIRISSPADPFKIIPDGDATEPDSSDASCWFEFEDYSIDAYRRAYPDSEMSSLNLTVPGAALSQWVGGDGIRVVKYWFKEEIEAIEYMLDDGTIVNNIGIYDPNEDEDEREDAREAFPDDAEGNDSNTEGKKVVIRSRTVLDTKVKWVIFNGVEVLDHGDWADSEFPFVSIYGPTLIVDGERDIRGIIRYAKDSQKMLNYMASSAIRRIGSSNKAPWIVDIKSIKGYENQWKTANTENWSMLPYNSIDPDNPQRPLPAPVRADQTGQIVDLLQAAQKFENDLKATIGIYDAGLGATPNDQSGIAIKTLAEQGMNSNFHYSDALARGIQRLGYLLIRLIPKIYDTPRVVRTIGDDSAERLVKINQIFVQNGEQKVHDMSQGDYGVAVAAGPSYASRKSQSLDQIIRLVGADPAVMPFIQDILVGEMDFDKAKVLQDRLRKLLALKAPGIIEEDGQAPVPPQIQAQLSQLAQLTQQQNQELQLMQQELQKYQIKEATQTIKHQQEKELIILKNQADLSIERERVIVAKEQALAKMNVDMAIKHMDHSHDMTKVVLEAAKDGHLADVVYSADHAANNPQP